MKKLLLIGFGCLFWSGVVSAGTMPLEEAVRLKIQQFETLQQTVEDMEDISALRQKRIAQKVERDIQMLQSQKESPDPNFLREFEQKTKAENAALLTELLQERKTRLEQQIKSFEQSRELRGVNKSFLKAARKKLQSTRLPLTNK